MDSVKLTFSHLDFVCAVLPSGPRSIRVPVCAPHHTSPFDAGSACSTQHIQALYRSLYSGARFLCEMATSYSFANLILNIDKTEELIFDFKMIRKVAPILVRGQPVEVVH